ncbi:PAS domain-containing protein [Tateyamaria omphalii]|uniref:PAS domain-containing protein n=2 Tax=Roseobacteraceae TaxID=2854170 RepID=UPI001C9952F0|nr:PAS domain-containing protein [Tateyamaria omphalii]MBY5934355.1 PAS domain-containing protein [Tateyamaria omphalii]
MIENTDLIEMRDLGFPAPERAAAMMSCTRDCVKLLSPEGLITYMSHNGRCAMEIDDLGAIVGRRWSEVWPSESTPLIEGAVTAACDGKMAHFIAECPTARQRLARWDVTVIGIAGQDGRLDEIMAVSRETLDPCRPLTIT